MFLEPGLSRGALDGIATSPRNAFCSRQVNGRVISKQIHVRVEHVSPSKCRDEIKRRIKENQAARKAAKQAGRE